MPFLLLVQQCQADHIPRRFKHTAVLPMSLPPSDQSTGMVVLQEGYFELRFEHGLLLFELNAGCGARVTVVSDWMSATKGSSVR